MSTPDGTTEIELAHRRHDLRVVRERASRSKLNKLDGVTATVNYATEKARVRLRRRVDPARARRAGRGRRLHRRAARAGRRGRRRGRRRRSPTPRAPLRDRLVVRALLTVPVIALAMVPALQFTTGSGCR